MSPELRAAIDAARAAGRIQRRHFRHRLAIETKPDATPVTRVDRASEAAIRQVLAPVILGAEFAGEESYEVAEGTDPWGRLRASTPCWIVDPLDGTRKFVRGLPFFGPCIALQRDGDLVLGVMHLPALGETLWAERGAGAFLNGVEIHVAEPSALDRAYVVIGNQAEFLRRSWGQSLGRLTGSIYHDPGFLDLYSYASLAAGRLDAVVMVGEAPWDVAAARLILEEAGGRFTDFRGAATIYSGTTLATAGSLHDELLPLLAACR